MKPITSIEKLELEGRTVLMRLDLNCPLKDGVVTSDARIRAALPSIRYALDKGARLVLASHLGRPKGERVAKCSLEPVAARLSELLVMDVILADDCIGDGVRTLTRDMRPEGVLMLENLRFHAGEEKNDEGFARQLAAPFDVYVNDAFGACHRAHASIVGAVQHIGRRGAGYLLQKEVRALGGLLSEPKRPFMAVVGGAKVSDKIGVLRSLLERVDVLCIGGAMAYTFLKARGVPVGTSLVEDDKLRLASEVLRSAQARDVEILLPVDHVAAQSFAEDAAATHVRTAELPSHLMGLDIGPETRAAYAAKVEAAETVFWNGPMGVFEWAKFAEGTMAMATAVSECRGFTVVGGGDSVAAIEKAGVAARVDHVSTGGGASLELLQYGTLPGLRALAGEAMV